MSLIKRIANAVVKGRSVKWIGAILLAKTEKVRGGWLVARVGK